MLIGLGSGKYASPYYQLQIPYSYFPSCPFLSQNHLLLGWIWMVQDHLKWRLLSDHNSLITIIAPVFGQKVVQSWERVLLQKAHSSFERGAKKNRWSRCPLHRSRDQFFGQKLVALESGNLEIFIILSFFWTPCLYLGKVIDFFFRSVFPRTPQTIISSF